MLDVQAQVLEQRINSLLSHLMLLPRQRKSIRGMYQVPASQPVALPCSLSPPFLPIHREVSGVAMLLLPLLVLEFCLSKFFFLVSFLLDKTGKLEIVQMKNRAPF